MNNSSNIVERIEEIEISKIKDFPNHPFKVEDDEKMKILMDSIQKQGVLYPAIVRQKDDGTYEMISGHRRKYASMKLGYATIKCIVKNLTDDEAIILMVDSNIQREEILPSEKAFAYKMKLDAIKHQGIKKDEIPKVFQRNTTCAPVVHKQEKSRDVVAEENNESAEQVRRYIRLTHLVDEVLNLVDQKKIGLRTAVELSYLSVDNQYYLFDIMDTNEVIPSLSQAIAFKKLEQNNSLTEEKISEIISQEKPNQKEKFSLDYNFVQSYFPSNYSQKQMRDVIKDLLEKYKSNWEKHKSAYEIKTKGSTQIDR